VVDALSPVDDKEADDVKLLTDVEGADGVIMAGEDVLKVVVTKVELLGIALVKEPLLPFMELEVSRVVLVDGPPDTLLYVIGDELLTGSANTVPELDTLEPLGAARSLEVDTALEEFMSPLLDSVLTEKKPGAVPLAL
jgi:hypothetical protein